jgi:hypothetical protein
MTINEVIQAVDSLKPNGYSELEKIQWLSELDGTIKAEIIDTHEGSEEITFNGYDETTPLETELIATAPYDRLYKSWLESRIDYANGDFTRYNNSVTVFNTDYLSYQRAYNSKHMPKGTKIKFF